MGKSHRQESKEDPIMLQAYHPKYKVLHDIVKLKDGTYSMRDQKGSIWGPIGLTKPKLVHICKNAGYQVF